MTDICFDKCTCGSVVVSDATAVAALKADNERLRAALDKMQRSRDRYRHAWEAEKARSALTAQPTEGEK